MLGLHPEAGTDVGDEARTRGLDLAVGRADPGAPRVEHGAGVADEVNDLEVGHGGRDPADDVHAQSNRLDHSNLLISERNSR